MNTPSQLTVFPNTAPTCHQGNYWISPTIGGSQVYWTWTYDHENQLTSVATDTYYTPEAYRWKVEFVYDGQGRLRIRRNYTWYNGAWYGSGGGTRYLYDGLLLVQERDSANWPLVTYTRGRDLSGTLAGAGGIGGLLARSHGYSGGNWSSHNFYHADGNGNVTALVNSSGTLQASYKYDPFGRYLAGGGSLASANVLRFSSKPWVAFAGSTTSGLYAYGYRFYDPYLQRWVNRDPIGESGGLNLYLFNSNKPLGVIDAYGLETLEECQRLAQKVHKYCKRRCTIGGIIMLGASVGLGFVTVNPWLGLGTAAFSALSTEVCNNNCDEALYEALEKCRQEHKHDCPQAQP